MSTNAAEVDFSNFSNLEEITSQRYPPQETSRKEQVIKFGYLPLKKKFNHKKRNFISRTILSEPELTSPVSLSNFQRKLFPFSVFWTSRREKSSSNPPG